MLEEIESDCLANPNKFWKHISRLGPKRKRKIPLKVKIGDDIVCDENIVLQTWKNEFSQLFELSEQNDVFDEDFLHQAEYFVTCITVE